MSGPSTPTASFVGGKHRVLISLLALGTNIPAWADLQITPSVTAGTVFVDNFDLSPPGAPKTSDWIGELVPRLQLHDDTPNLSAVLDYSAQGLLFADHSSFDAIHSVGAANMTWMALSDVLFIDARTAYTQQTVDPTRPGNDQNLLGVGNVANEFDAMVAPYLKHDYGTMTGMLRFQESISDFSGAEGEDAGLLENSRTNVITADLASDPSDAFLLWRLNAQSARTTFKQAQPFRDDRAVIEGSEAIVLSLRLTETVGTETNVIEHSTSGGLDSLFWLAGFKWAPSTRTSLEASAGHRFFGPSYVVNFHHESRLFNFHAVYSEVATNASETVALTDFIAGQQTDPRAYNGVLRSIDTYDPFIAKQWDVGLEFQLHRTQLSARFYDLRRDYISPELAGSSDLTKGYSVELNRQFGSRDNLKVGAEIDTADETSGFVYHDHRYSAEYSRQLSRTMSVSAVFVRIERDGTAQYRADIGELLLRKTF